MNLLSTLIVVVICLLLSHILGIMRAKRADSATIVALCKVRDVLLDTRTRLECRCDAAQNAATAYKYYADAQRKMNAEQSEQLRTERAVVQALTRQCDALEKREHDLETALAQYRKRRTAKTSND